MLIADGTALESADCAGGPYQHWVSQADGSVRNPQSGRCLDNGARLQLWDCNASAAQRFTVS